MELQLLKSEIQSMKNSMKKMEEHQVFIVKKMEEQILELRSQIAELTNEQNAQEIYYQKILEQRFPGAGHRTLKTASGSTIITDVTSPDDWNSSEHDGMPSFHIEIKKTLGYKEILTQLLMAQAALPRQLLVGVLFVNPAMKRLKDIFELFHPQGIKLAYFDHHDQLWWFDGKDKKAWKEMWSNVNETNIWKIAKNELLEQSSTDGITTSEFKERFMEWINFTAPHLMPVIQSTKHGFYGEMDKVLTGDVLDASRRRFYKGTSQVSGWSGWKFKAT